MSVSLVLMYKYENECSWKANEMKKIIVEDAKISLSMIMCRSLKTFQHIDHLQTLVVTYIFTILCKLTWNNVIFVMRWWLKWFIMWVPFAKYLQSYFCVNGIILRTWESSKIFSWWANRILWNHTLWSDIFIWL